MNLNLLKAFLTVADTGSFSKAAERLFISQPALSQNIKWLENYFNVRLIKRGPHNLSLTEAGELLRDYAEKLVKTADSMDEAMATFRSSLNDTLLVGATSSIGGYAVPCSIFIFKRKYPNANIKLILGNRYHLLDQLREGQLDIAIAGGEMPGPPFTSSQIYTEEMLVVAPNTPEWNTRTHISLQEFRSLPLIVREAGSATRWTIEQSCRQAGIGLQDLTIVMELHSTDSIKVAVEAGHGVSILPRLAIKKELYNKTLHPLQIENLSFFQPIFLVHKKEKSRIVAAEFIKLLKSPANGFC